MLDAFIEPRGWEQRIKADPIEFPHRYSNPRDVEVVGLLSTALAYGRADLFKPKIAGLLEQMGRSPSEFMASLTIPRAKKLLDGFVYRFNLPADLAVLLMGIGRALETHGSLEGQFLHSIKETTTRSEALAHFGAAIRDGAPHAPIVRALGPVRGLSHLLPVATGGAAKRMNLYLRWMVRGPDRVDFGVWKRVQPSELVIPLDTHIARLSVWLGLTKRNDMSWKTAEDITASLRVLDAKDPVKYDFALCHYGMSGACPVKPVKTNCAKCELRNECSIGRRS